MSADDTSRIARKMRLGQAFTPRAPVSSKELFEGRTDQIQRCLMALAQPGVHLAVYGERGVGKTSLSKILPQWLRELKHPQLKAVRVDCNTNDNFHSLWRNIFRELRQPWTQGDGPLDPDGVRYRLAQSDALKLIVIDELDRLDDDASLSLLADTIKTLSDHTVGSILMLVGVADSLDRLIGEHESIARCLDPVEMPRMYASELRDILDKRYSNVSMTIDPSARDLVVGMAEGLPHFVHLLGLSAGVHAIDDDRPKVTRTDVHRALREQVKAHTLMTEYRRATHSTQPTHLYEHVLLACAMVPKDELGWFRAGDVVQPLADVLKRPVTIPLYSPHLNEFASDHRGNVLQKEGSSHRFRYRFRNPLLQPFAKMVSLSSGRIDHLVLEQYPARVPVQPTLDWPPTEPYQT